MNLSFISWQFYQNNGGCSPFATCTHTGQDERICTCKQNYTGDGFICRGSIYGVTLSLPAVNPMSQMAESPGCHEKSKTYPGKTYPGKLLWPGKGVVSRLRPPETPGFGSALQGVALHITRDLGKKMIRTAVLTELNVVEDVRSTEHVIMLEHCYALGRCVNRCV